MNQEAVSLRCSPSGIGKLSSEKPKARRVWPPVVSSVVSTMFSSQQIVFQKHFIHLFPHYCYLFTLAVVPSLPEVGFVQATENLGYDSPEVFLLRGVYVTSEVSNIIP